MSKESDIESYCSEEDEIKSVIDEYNREISEVPVSYPEVYGLTKEKALKMIESLEKERDKEVEEIKQQYRVRYRVSKSVFYGESEKNRNSTSSNGRNLTYNNSMTVVNLKTPKVKSSVVHKPSIQRPKGQSLHPNRNKRNALNRKRARANQTNVKAILTNAAAFGSLFGAAAGLYQEFSNRSKSNRIVEVIKRMSNGYKLLYDYTICRFLNRLLIALPIVSYDYEVLFSQCITIDEKVNLFKIIYEELYIKFCCCNYDYRKYKYIQLNNI